MITQMTLANIDEYKHLFDKALQVLWGGQGVMESVDLSSISIDDIPTVADLTYALFQKDLKDKFVLIDGSVSIKEIKDKNIVVYKINSDEEIASITPIEMNTLSEYFASLGTLKERLENPQEDMGQFLALPIDEPMFHIDANTRTIDIPTEFARNGVAVQGDNGAEILYFRINRYFDAIDLSTTSIVIQYELPDEKDPSLQFGTSPALFKQIVSEKIEKKDDYINDYVIFGWELDKKITKNPGNVKFAIRFLLNNGATDEEGKIQYTYSLSTLTTTVGINKALQLNESYLSPDTSVVNNILNRINNSPAPEGIIKLQNPQFELPKSNIEIDFLTKERTDENGDTQYFDELVAQAYGPAGKIDYKWYVDGRRLDEGKQEMFYDKLSREEQEQELPKDYLTYFAYDNSNDLYAVYPLETGETFPSYDTTPLYLRKYKKEITSPGVYTVTAQAIALNGVSSVTTHDKTWTVSHPEDVKLTKTTSSSCVVLQDKGEKQYETTIGVSISNIDSYQKKDGYEVNWYRNYNANNTQPLKDITTLQYTVTIDGTTTPETLKQLQGVYSIEVTGKKNNAKSKKAIEEFIVTLPAMKPNVNIRKNSENDPMQLGENQITLTATSGNSLTAYGSYVGDYQIDQVYTRKLNNTEGTISEPTVIHSTNVDWYKLTGLSANAIQDLGKKAKKGELTLTVLDEYKATNSSVDYEKIETENGKLEVVNALTDSYNYYFCIITNNYNGDTNAASSPIVEVTK